MSPRPGWQRLPRQGLEEQLARSSSEQPEMAPS